MLLNVSRIRDTYLALSHVIANVTNLSLNIIHGHLLKLLRCNHANPPLQQRLPGYVLVVEFWTLPS